MSKILGKYWVRFCLPWLLGFTAAINPLALAGQTLVGPSDAATAVPRDQSGQNGGSVVTAMGNLGPHSGWVLMGNRLASTADDGQSWTDITPPATGNEPVDQVYFLDAMNGWLLKTRYSLIKDSEVRSLVVCHTADGGKTWASTPILTANPGDVEQFFRRGGLSIFRL